MELTNWQMGRNQIRRKWLGPFRRSQTWVDSELRGQSTHLPTIVRVQTTLFLKHEFEHKHKQKYKFEHTENNLRPDGSSPSHYEGIPVQLLYFSKLNTNTNTNRNKNQILTRKKNPRPIGWTPQPLWGSNYVENTIFLKPKLWNKCGGIGQYDIFGFLLLMRPITKFNCSFLENVCLYANQIVYIWWSGRRARAQIEYGGRWSYSDSHRSA